MYLPSLLLWFCSFADVVEVGRETDDTDAGNEGVTFLAECGDEIDDVVVDIGANSSKSNLNLVILLLLSLAAPLSIVVFV